MIVTLIAAVDRNGVIGKGGRLPWHLPLDMQRFRQTTMGHPVVMGRTTWESIGHPLDGRHLIVVSTTLTPPGLDGVTVARSLDEAFRIARERDDELFVAGGESIYRQTIDRADRILLTLIDASFDGDRHFPPIPPDRFRQVGSEPAADILPLCFVEYRRIWS